MKLEKPIIFFDLETTGVDTTVDRIVQIATIKIYPDGQREEKNYLINPTIPIPQEASDVHGITDEDVKDEPTFEKFAKSLFNYFNNSDIGGYNSNNYDVPLLVEEFKRSGLDFDVSGRNYIDVLRIETELNPRTLEAVYKRYTGKELSGAHDALADVKGTIEVFEKQLSHFDDNIGFDEVDKFSQGDKERVDLAGKLCKIDGQICWTFGKNRNLPITRDVQYAMWYLRQSVPSETAKIIKETLNKK